ncbi:hypothetical protein [Altibacter lentus]|uniref:hypothetical protein n=1 Tax=Altibacter lentus TaxID=1223410 RepID=UPI00054D8310|nr:hypothetical protein [Altibacter lentus]
MRILKIILLVSAFLFFSACNNSQYSSQEIETKADQITDKLNENNIKIFRNWSFEYRGKGEIWTKSRKARTDYRAYYFKEKDSVSFLVFSKDLKSPEYPCLINIDTSKYQSNFWFTKLSDDRIKISATKKDGTNTVIGENLLAEKVFGDKNPFDELQELSELKDKIEVYSIFHNQSVGEFIEFYITYEDVLTYIPDEMNLNPLIEKVWMKNFESGKYIKDNWNLRKLKSPKEGG